MTQPTKAALQELRDLAAKGEKTHRQYAEKHGKIDEISALHHGAANGFEIMRGLIEEKQAALEAALEERDG